VVHVRAEARTSHPCAPALSLQQESDQRQNNKQVALTLLEAAKNEIIRSRHLGYLSDDAEYKATSSVSV